MKYIGLDAHKTIIVASVISDKGKNVKTMSVEASVSGLEKIHQYLNGKKYCVIMESSTYAYLPYRFFDDLGVETYMIHAQSFKVITDTDRKTDLLDQTSWESIYASGREKRLSYQCRLFLQENNVN